MDISLLNGPETTHAQHIHTGTRCPTLADDTNGDGVIDATEATSVYGPVLIPLDSDLASQATETFPSGSSYQYNQSTSLTQLLANFGLENIGLEGKVINIHGVPDSVVLPTTIQGTKAAFPISCGVLVRIQGEVAPPVVPPATPPPVGGPY